MSNRMPSLLALLGVAAAAGYQNRDKLGQFLDRIQAPQNAPDAPANLSDFAQDGLSGTPDRGLAQTFRTGVSELIDRFRGLGETDIPQSWVSTGQNRAIHPDRLREVLGPEMIAELATKTGLTEVDLLAQLAQVLPDTVDHLTPDGQVPAMAPIPGAAQTA